MGGQLAEFKKRRAGVEQTIDALARQQFAARGVPLLGLGAAALLHVGEQGVQGVDLLAHRRAVGGKLRRAGLSWLCKVAMVRSFSGFR